MPVTPSTLRITTLAPFISLLTVVGASSCGAPPAASSARAPTQAETTRASAVTPAPSPPASLREERRAWYRFGFANPVTDQVVLHYLGQAWHQSADVGEVLETAGRVDESDPTSWTREWRATAERLGELGRTSEASGNRFSAAHAHLRAATYYRAALHQHPDPRSPEVRELAEREVTSFGKYLTLSRSPCTAIRIPYERTTLPGYFCKSPTARGRGPVVLFQEGRDGWAEDGRFLSEEAMKRGMHALMFDGPGMGQALRLQGLPFRPDWERVVGAVVDYASARGDVDASRLGLVAVSMGGFLGPRAASRESRLKVLVANPGVVDWSRVYEGYLRRIDPGLVALLDTDEAAFDRRVGAIMQRSAFLRWGLVDAEWHHGVDTPGKLMKDLRRYRLGAEDVARIRARTLVVDAEAEEWGQSKELFAALTARKDYLLFTSAEAAQFHVQPGASAIASQRLLDWLEGAL